MQSMTVEQRKQAEAALKIAAASGIDGAVEAVQSQLAGLPPMTEEAQKFAAMAPQAYSSLMKTTDRAMSGTLKDFNGAFKEFAIASGENAKDLGMAGQALTFMGGATGKVSTGLIAFDNLFRGSPEEVEKRLAGIMDEKSEAEKSMAENMAAIEKDFQEFGQALIGALMPVFQMLIVPLRAIGMLFGGLAKFIAFLNEKLAGLGNIAVVGVIGVLLLFKYQMLRAAAQIGASFTRNLAGKIFGGDSEFDDGDDRNRRRRRGRGRGRGRGGRGGGAL